MKFYSLYVMLKPGSIIEAFKIYKINSSDGSLMCVTPKGVNSDMCV